jgi:AI-2 transport protein TqsA
MPVSDLNRGSLRIISFCLVFVSIVLFVFILKTLESFLILFVIAIFLTLMLDPAVNYLQKQKLPRWLSILILLIVVFILIYLFGLLIISSFSQLPQKFGMYSEKFQGLFSSFQGFAEDITKRFGEKFGVQTEDFNLTGELTGFIDSTFIGQSIISITTFISNVIFIMIFWLFMIGGKPKFEKKIRNIYSEKKGLFVERMNATVNKIQSFMFYKTVLALGNAIIMTLLYLIFGVEFAIIWGFLMFVMDFVPNVGPLIAMTPPFLIAILQYGISFNSITLIAIGAAIQIWKGNYFEPKLFGTQMNLSPVFIIFSVFFWSYVWGITGAFLAVPIAYVIKIIFEYIEPLKPYSILLGNSTRAGK